MYFDLLIDIECNSRVWNFQYINTPSQGIRVCFLITSIGGKFVIVVVVKDDLIHVYTLNVPHIFCHMLTYRTYRMGYFYMTTIFFIIYFIMNLEIKFINSRLRRCVVFMEI